MSTRVSQTLIETNTLLSKVDHVRRIIDAQQDIARPGGLQEPVRLEELAEQALMINREDINHHKIEVVQEYEVLPQVVVDKHQILQILVNLIRNAKHAMISKGGSSHSLMLRIQRSVHQEGLGRLWGSYAVVRVRCVISRTLLLGRCGLQ